MSKFNSKSNPNPKSISISTTTNHHNNNNIRNTIIFNYSENFNRVTELNRENYITWRRNMLYLLNINKLTKYILILLLKN